MRRFHLSAFAAILLTLFTVSSASAQISWSKVKSRAKASSYSTLYKYKGPRGTYTFKYDYNKGAVRAEVLKAKDRSRVGTVFVYDKKFNPKKIRIKTGGGLISRNTTHKAIKDTPFYRSMHTWIIGQAEAYGKPKAKKAGKNTLFTFGGGKYKVWTNSRGDILKTERKTKKQKEIRRLSGHKWDNSPKIKF